MSFSLRASEGLLRLSEEREAEGEAAYANEHMRGLCLPRLTLSPFTVLSHLPVSPPAAVILPPSLSLSVSRPGRTPTLSLHPPGS